MPAATALGTVYAHALYVTFGEVPYLVGSAIYGKEWRDVDVRLLLPDEEFTRRFGEDWAKGLSWGYAWEMTCWAFALLGRELTGLPIDFQIQPVTWANAKFPGRRSALLGFQLAGGT